MSADQATLHKVEEAMPRERGLQAWQRLCEHEPVFARMHAARARLKQYCEQRARAFTDHDPSYGYLRCMIFGVEWDPSDYFRVTVSLHWQQRHSDFAILTAACEEAWRVLREENESINTEEGPQFSDADA